MRKIVLTSCGIRNDDFKEKFYNLISKEDLKNSKVLYITTAVDGEAGDNSDWVNKEYQTILDLGINELDTIIISKKVQILTLKLGLDSLKVMRLYHMTDT